VHCSSKLFSKIRENLNQYSTLRNPHENVYPQVPRSTICDNVEIDETSPKDRRNHEK